MKYSASFCVGTVLGYTNLYETRILYLVSLAVIDIDTRTETRARIHIGEKGIQ